MVEQQIKNSKNSPLKRNIDSKAVKWTDKIHNYKILILCLFYFNNWLSEVIECYVSYMFDWI